MQHFDREDIELLADYFYELFLPRFVDQPEGSLVTGTKIEVSRRMTTKIGLALLFENKIRISESYFVEHPHFLPYTMFHEMTHLWLYHCGLDPGHTRKFYRKMEEFKDTGYLVDPEVHIHSRLSDDSPFVYVCENCHNRWHVKEELAHEIFCGLCWKKEKQRYFAVFCRSEEFLYSETQDSVGEDLDCA